MHIGNYLSSELKKQGISVPEVAKLVNKSDTGVRKDLDKDSLHQSVIEAYARVLGINIYRVLAEAYEGKPYPELSESVHAEVNEEEVQKFQPASKGIEVLSINLSVPADKQEAFLKLLLS